MNENTKKELQSAAFERLVKHLREKKNVQNIDLMNLAGFCRNCLSKWYHEEAKKKGITKIICIAVNDPNVMKAWGEHQNVQDKIFMAADPYCEFTKLIGAEIDKTEKGLGIRSARYTMLVENNIAKIIKEEEDTGMCETSAEENFIKDI